MRDRMERFVVLPFSVGCVSESSVAVAVQPPRRSKPADTNSTATRKREEDEESLSSESMKYSLKFLPLPKPDISTGFHRLFKSFKTLSQLFAYKEEMEDSEEDMEIGFPTDVKHVAHIGLDDSASTSTSMGSWDNLLSPQQLFTFPSVPSGQCELPMETHAAAGSPLVHAST
ncbi:CRIB domain-containing protein RIC4-like [Durio zibethinus]|uniref:CRIB domain-containing protein RIC4-like n=1 Tax=Durio zibethinus TaxID=66656 RepID=A0A6P5YUG1_DURZI|nr:CRIB domain-containing protein RIC4-like [Durio zibethinus]